MKAEESYFLISQADVEKIDSLVGALNLAISEILESRPVEDNRAERKERQRKYDSEVSDVIYYRGDLRNHF